MRATAIAVIAALAAASVAGPAAARAWNDPNGRVTLDLPSGWTADPQPCEGCTYVMAFNPSRDCHVLVNPRDQALGLGRVRAIAGNREQINEQVWRNGANALTGIFPADSAQVVSQTTETDSFFPLQRAELRNGEGQVIHGAMQLRPDAEIWAFCLTVGGTDNASSYDALFRSIGTPNDAALRSQIEAAEAAAAPAAPAPAPAPTN
jgi:hypothetical protein